VPINPGWESALERITLTGPEGVAFLDQDDERRITVVTASPGSDACARFCGTGRGRCRTCSGTRPGWQWAWCAGSKKRCGCGG